MTPSSFTIESHGLIFEWTVQSSDTGFVAECTAPPVVVTGLTIGDVVGRAIDETEMMSSRWDD